MAERFKASLVRGLRKNAAKVMEFLRHFAPFCGIVRLFPHYLENIFFHGGRKSAVAARLSEYPK
jgi:hypothetical protein